jgi:hypothetical protein
MMGSWVNLVLVLAFTSGHASAANFDCALYVSTCSGVSGYQAYSNCAATAIANGNAGMSCRKQHLALAAAGGANDPATHCPHAQPVATGPCANENVTAVFNCAQYVSTCSGVAGYQAYQDCAIQVQQNAATMTCRIQHLALAAAGGANDPATHCPHAQPVATGPCASETLKTFDCSLYATTCSGLSGYEAYADCAGTVAANSNKMTCRIQHLDLAANGGNNSAATHCPHAKPSAVGPCASETLSPAPAPSVQTSGSFAACISILCTSMLVVLALTANLSA